MFGDANIVNVQIQDYKGVCLIGLNWLVEGGMRLIVEGPPKRAAVLFLSFFTTTEVGFCFDSGSPCTTIIPEVSLLT